MTAGLRKELMTDNLEVPDLIVMKAQDLLNEGDDMEEKVIIYGKAG